MCLDWFAWMTTGFLCLVLVRTWDFVAVINGDDMDMVIRGMKTCGASAVRSHLPVIKPAEQGWFPVSEPSPFHVRSW